MRARGQKGVNDATAVLFTSALYRKVDFDRHLAQGSPVKLFRGEIHDAVCADEQDPYLYYVKSGALEVGLTHGDDPQSYFFVRGAGDAVLAGLSGCLPFGLSRLTFKAVRNTVLVGFTQKQVREFMLADAAFFDDVMYSMHMTLAQMGHRVSIIDRQSSSKRMLLWLEKLCEANDPDETGVYRIPCNLIVDEVSGLLGIHYATCSKLLKALKDRGIADRTSKELVVLDRTQLRALLQEENPVLY